MAVRPELSAPEAADRLAIRKLFDAYAHRADRRNAEGQKALFTVDTRFAVYIDGEGSEPSHVLEGRHALTPVFADLIVTRRRPTSTGRARSRSRGTTPPGRATRSRTTSTPPIPAARS
jgi:SnoaL-like domain